jgi:hypothetical protein
MHHCVLRERDGGRAHLSTVGGASFSAARISRRIFCSISTSRPGGGGCITCVRLSTYACCLSCNSFDRACHTARPASRLSLLAPSAPGGVLRHAGLELVLTLVLKWVLENSLG